MGLVLVWVFPLDLGFNRYQFLFSKAACTAAFIFLGRYCCV